MADKPVLKLVQNPPEARPNCEAFLQEQIEQLKAEERRCEEIVIVRLYTDGEGAETAVVGGTGTAATTLWALARAQNIMIS